MVVPAHARGDGGDAHAACAVVTVPRYSLNNRNELAAYAAVLKIPNTAAATLAPYVYVQKPAVSAKRTMKAIRYISVSILVLINSDKSQLIGNLRTSLMLNRKTKLQMSVVMKLETATKMNHLEYHGDAKDIHRIPRISCIIFKRPAGVLK